MAWEHAAEARAALNAIVTDPEHGVDALASPRTMSNLLNDLLPDAPREKNLLLAAAEAGLADSLREHVAQGMDSSTAIRLTASSFAARSPLTPDACRWVTGEIAVALGISQTNDAGYLPGPTVPPSPTVTAPGQGGPQLGSAGQASGQAKFGPGPTTAAPGAAGFSPGAAGYPPGPAGYAPGPAGFSPGAVGYPPGPAGYSPGAAGYPPGPAGFSPEYPSLAEQFFGPTPGIGYPPVQVPGLVQGYQPGQVAGQGRKNNTLAVTSLVLGLGQLVGWVFFVLPGLIAAILAIVFGLASMKQIKRSGEKGHGLAITGVILGFLGIIIMGLVVVVDVVAANN